MGRNGMRVNVLSGGLGAGVGWWCKPLVKVDDGLADEEERDGY